MLFSYGSDLNSSSGSTKQKTLVESMLPQTNPWIMCMTTNNQEYYMNLFTHQITYQKPSLFKDYENRLLDKQRQETAKELEIFRRKAHIYEGKAYEELYANSDDPYFIINPAYTHEKGDTVWYIPNSTDPLIKSTIVAVHHDKPPFYTLRYIITNGAESSVVEKNTTSVRIMKCK